MKYIIDIQSERLKEAGEQDGRTTQEERHSLFSLIHSIDDCSQFYFYRQRNIHFLSCPEIWKGSYFISETILFPLVVHLIINRSTTTSSRSVWRPLFAGHWRCSRSPCCRLIRDLIRFVMQGTV